MEKVSILNLIGMDREFLIFAPELFLQRVLPATGCKSSNIIIVNNSVVKGALSPEARLKMGLTLISLNLRYSVFSLSISLFWRGDNKQLIFYHIVKKSISLLIYLLFLLINISLGLNIYIALFLLCAFFSLKPTLYLCLKPQWTLELFALFPFDNIGQQ